MGLALLRSSSQRELVDCDRPDMPLERLRSSGSRATLQITCNVRTLCSRVQTILRQRRRKQRSLPISAPFNFQREPVLLPGISEDELAMLREKAAASCIGIADPTAPHSPSSTSSLFSHPARPAIVTVHPPHATVSTESF